MTPAIKLLEQRKIAHTIHEYLHDAGAASYGLEAAEKLDVPPERVFKTLVVSLDNRELAVAMLPVNTSLSMKLVAKALGARKATMAAPADVARVTGYVLGGVSPLGQKKRLRSVLDSSAGEYRTILVSAGRRGLEVELAASDLGQILGAREAAICQLEGEAPA